MSDNKKKPQPSKKHQINWRTVGYSAALLAWVGISMTISQYAIGFPLIWILGDRFSQPFYTCMYYGLTYILALALVILAPPLICKLPLFSKLTRSPDSTLHSKSVSKFPSKPLLTTSREELGLKNLPTIIDVILAPIAYIVYIVLSYVCTSAMSVFSWFDTEQAQDVGFGYFITTGDRVIAMIALVFIAPIAEEIIMRGWLYGKLREKLNLPVAILLTSLLFGVLHGQWNVGVGVFALSIVLCGLREVTGTIWSGMLLHMLSNGIAFYLLYIAF